MESRKVGPVRSIVLCEISRIFSLHICATSPKLVCVTRRRFIQGGLAVGLSFRSGIVSPILAASKRERMDEAVAILERATREGQVTSAVVHMVQGEKSFTRAFGKANGEDAMFLLGSISKPVSITALMTLYERGQFKLGDPLRKFIPQFAGGNR